MVGTRLASVLAATALLVAGCGSGGPPVTGVTAPPPTTAAPSTSTSAPGPATTTAAVPTTAGGPASSTAPSTADDGGARFERRFGTSPFLVGANLPWYHWGCDFGCGTSGGVSSPEVAAAIDARFAEAAAAGIDVIRWWLFPGDPALQRDGLPTKIESDADGWPAAISPVALQDLDAALEIARRHDVTLVLTLFSAPTQLPAPWLETAEGRQRLATTLGTLFERYRDDPTIVTWQVFNEPEWEVWNGEVSEDDLRALIAVVAAEVKARSDALVSVGGARLDGIPMMQGLGLDYYTVHWYDPMTEAYDCLACTTYAEIQARTGLDAPLVVGEFYSGRDGLERLRLFHRVGFSGAMAWSLFSQHTTDGMEVDLAAYAQFAAELDTTAP